MTKDQSENLNDSVTIMKLDINGKGDNYKDHKITT